MSETVAREPSQADTSGRAAAVRTAAARLGIERLHGEQEQVIADVLDERDVLMILPTGFGKSACYQIPSMVLPKPVVLISPLLALLRDQEEKLLKRDIPCVRVDGTVRGRTRAGALARVERGEPLLVMTTPETLATEEMAGALAKSGVSLLAVDEAHCISEWGHDFRPAYRRISTHLRALGSPPILALTATATPRVRSAVVRSLGMRTPTVVASSPHRSNLAFEVIECDADVRPSALVRLVRKLRRPGLVYCATTREVDALHLLLQRIGVPAHRYHGGMNASERQVEQQRFMRRRRRPVMVATSAFGLGIDKPDIRYVLHYQSPASLEQYVQEAGRSGRDGRKANCLLFYAPSDREIHELLLARSRVRPEQLYRLGRTLTSWAHERRDPSLEALALSAELGPRITSALLVKIEEAGLVARVGSEVRITGAPESIEADVRNLAAQFETLRTQDSRRLDAIGAYAGSDVCRAVFLRAYFGEEAEESCGLCDVCLQKPSRPAGFFAPVSAPKPPPRRPRRRRSRRASGRERGSPRRTGSPRKRSRRPRD